MIAFRRGLEIYDAWFALSNLRFTGAWLFRTPKKVSSNSLHDLIFLFEKADFKSSLKSAQLKVL